jgi:exodeoxyribonuclease V beta subunit
MVDALRTRLTSRPAPRAGPMTHTTPLDPLTLPLHGSRLLQASAGTGKTWTIAALYVRLVLGHGASGIGFERALGVGEILVLTFTRAATQELGARIRARLLQAAQVFRAAGLGAGGDPFLQGLLRDYPETAAQRQAAWLLERAAQGMDAAAIYTIDAWCQRSLREHAFHSGQLLDEALVADEAPLLREAVQDYWRQQLYPLSGELLELALGVWSSIEKMLADVRHFLPFQAGLAPLQVSSVAALIAQTLQAQQTALVPLKTAARAQAHAMILWLQSQFDLQDGPFDKKKFRMQYAQPWIQALLDWADAPALVQPGLSDKAWYRLQPAGLHEVVKPGYQLALPPVFTQFAQLAHSLAALPTLPSQLRQHAAYHVTQRMAQLKKQAHTVGFDDLQNRLDAALNGPQAALLRSGLLAQYPVALVDEFQDTSRVQLRILDALYRLSGNDPQHGIFLIGDPKQSIYGFRGADIGSYLEASRATAGRHDMLSTNHRSSVELVEAVNQLFYTAQVREGEGAFMFRSASCDDPVPFIPVAARGLSAQLKNEHGSVPAITWCLDPEPAPRAQGLAQFAQRCAEQMAALLSDPVCGFSEPDGEFTRLRCLDIAVLVRDRSEADAVRAALQQQRIASVFLSDRHSVFNTPEAADLLRFLQAVSQPRDARGVRAALASPLLAWSVAELQGLVHSETALDAQLLHFAELERVWSSQGVLAMLRRALHLFKLPSRWQHGADAERRLTNVLHLAELLQHASLSVQGASSLMDWFTLQLAGEAQSGADEHLMRLESDADVVKVVTIHKSKGLEYPLVFLPFAGAAKPRTAANTPVLACADAQSQHQLHTEITPELLAQAERERLREDLRLLYVALTRARHAVWAGVAIVQPSNRSSHEFHRSALGYLLSGPRAVSPAEIHAALEQQVAAAPSMQLCLISDVPGSSTVMSSSAELPALTKPLLYSAQFDTRWRISSFSGLVRKRTLVTPVALLGHVREDELIAETARALMPSSQAPAAWHTFPKGPVAGHFLHTQLEWLAGQNFALDAAPAVQQQLVLRCTRAGLGHLAGSVLAWLGAVLTAPLPPLQASLCQLTTVLPEMEFWLPNSGLDTAHMDALCQTHLLSGQPRPALAPSQLHGMLMGFADLICEYQGRYWVLDYKSNMLGTQDSDYCPQALEAAMAAHRYDLQAVIYQFALHRLLQSRLGSSYDPEVHLGGAIYFFLRGINTPHRGCYHVPVNLALIEVMEAGL